MERPSPFPHIRHLSSGNPWEFEHDPELKMDGYGTALMPIAAINLFGFTTPPQRSQLVAAMGLVGAVAVLGLGPLIDRVGAKRMLIFTIFFVALHALLLAETQ
jgi:MFS family permease